MAIGFPTSPTIGQQYPVVDPLWEWNGTVWESLSGTPVTLRYTSLVSTDDALFLRGGVPGLVSAAVMSAELGGGVSPTAPAAFTAGQWTAAATANPGEISFNLTALPGDGGSAITALQYRVGTGAAIAFTGTDTGVRVVTAGLTAGQAVDLQVRAVNAVGVGAWSDIKNRTPLASAPPSGAAGWESAATTLNGTTFGGGTTPTQPAGLVASDLQLMVITNMTAAARATLTPPAGWTLVGEVYSAFADLGHAVYRAAGNVAAGAWQSTTGANSLVFEIHRISGANASTPIRSYTPRATTPAGTFADDQANMPTPSATAVAGDLVLSFYNAPQSSTQGGAPTAGYTRVLESIDPNVRSTLVLENAAAGPTGEISHNHPADFQQRHGCTIVIASA